MNAKIIEIRNGIAKVEWRHGSEPALMEISPGQTVGDEVPESLLVFNGGESDYDELSNRFDGDAHP